MPETTKRDRTVTGKAKGGSQPLNVLRQEASDVVRA